MSVYLDNAAACPCDSDTIDFFRAAMIRFFANQESLGIHGKECSVALRESAERLSSALCGSEKSGSLLWTNTGTGALLTAVEGTSEEWNGDIVTTPLEHPALFLALERAAKRNGCTVHCCEVEHDGRIKPESLERLLSDRTALLAMHHVQSETGTIQDLVLVRSLLDRCAPRALFLADTIQSAGKIRIPWEEARLDMMTVSGQKIGCPSGGALIYRPKLEKQVRRMRSVSHQIGRCVPAAAMTLANHLSELLLELDENAAYAADLKDTLRSSLTKNGISYHQTVKAGHSSPYILHMTLPPYQGAILTRALHAYEISVAPGSACESESGGGSQALKAMGFSSQETFCALRVSTWVDNTVEDMLTFSDALGECIRKY